MATSINDKSITDRTRVCVDVLTVTLPRLIIHTINTRNVYGHNLKNDIKPILRD